MQRIRLAWLLVCIWHAMPAHAQPGSTTQPSPTVAVLIDAPLRARNVKHVMMFEQELSPARGVRFVDREHINQLLDEHRLNAILSPDGATDRIQTGRLLSADILVAFHASKSETDSVDVVICETAIGLRLTISSFRLQDVPAEVSRSLNQQLDSALSKHSQAIRRIYAVPPFVSQDLLHTYDSMQQSCAKLLEQTLLMQPGSAVVELEEARAIGRELSLSKTNGIVKPLPLYVLGEYRNAGHGDARRTNIVLRFHRGDEELDRIEQRDLRSDGLAAFIRNSTLATVAKYDGSQTRSDPKAEARELARRGSILKGLSNYEAALNLVEASLLLDPDQPRLHFDAANILERLPAVPSRNRISEKLTLEQATAKLQYEELQIQHAEAYLRTIHLGTDAPVIVETLNFIAHVMGQSDPNAFPNTLMPRVREISRLKRDMLFRVLDQRKLRGDNALLYQLWVPGGEFYSRLDTPEEDLEYRLRALRLYSGLSSAEATYWALTFEKSPAEMMADDYQKILAAADTINDAEVRKGLAQVRAEIEKDRRQIAAVTDRNRSVRTPARMPPTTTPQTYGSVSFTRLELPATDEARNPCVVPTRINLIPCGKDTDLVSGLKDLYLMKEKGRLKRIFHSDEQFFNFSGVCFDGRFIWAPAKRPNPLVLVIDPITERVWKLDATNGLPPMSSGVQASALEPGRICLSGSFGRSWIADVRFTPETGAKIDIFFEAREVHDDLDNDAWKNVHEAYLPTWMITIFVPGSQPPQRRVLVGRSYYPLLVDPDQRSVEVLPDSVSSSMSGRNFAIHDGALYWSVPTLGREEKKTMWRFGLPELKRQKIQPELPTEHGIVVFDEDRVHLIGERWWSATKLGDTFRLYDGAVPSLYYLRHFERSNHFGLVMISGRDSDGGVYQVHVRPGDTLP